MAKLVRRGGKLLRKSGKLVRSETDLDPDSPCECCENLPPDPGSWFCNARTGACTFRLEAGGFATQAECQANCSAATFTWNCAITDDPDINPCVGVAGNGGQYLTLAECQADCNNVFP